LVVKEPQVKKVAGLIVILVAKASVNHVVDKKAKNEPNTQLAVQHQPPVKKKGNQRLGVKNLPRGKNNEIINRKL